MSGDFLAQKIRREQYWSWKAERQRLDEQQMELTEYNNE